MHCIGEFMQKRFGLLPADTGVGDALAVDEILVIAPILASGHQKTFNHNSNDAWIPALSTCNIPPHIDLLFLGALA